jgi:hypothetical protein
LVVLHRNLKLITITAQPIKLSGEIMSFIDSVIKQELSITESPKFFDLEFKNQHVDFNDKEKMIEVGKKLCANNLFIRFVHCLSLIAS